MPHPRRRLIPATLCATAAVAFMAVGTHPAWTTPQAVGWLVAAVAAALTAAGDLALAYAAAVRRVEELIAAAERASTGEAR